MRPSDLEIVYAIRKKLHKGNVDNISRTKYYQSFYIKHPEIMWSFLASMVSRNAGWNMCDLFNESMCQLLSRKIRKRLLLTYERANWLIFRDAYPQLLLYHYSTKWDDPLFHLLDHFFVSSFMKKEWNHFWEKRNRKRLLYALIVNEQHVIQQPVLEHPLYKKRIFNSSFFLLQDTFHFSAVIFPTLGGELYGASVGQFRKPWKRIELGKKLANILFHEELYPYFLQFALKTEPTGSRNDYERNMDVKIDRNTPILRAVVPVIEHHAGKQIDWTNKFPLRNEWTKHAPIPAEIVLTKWFIKKQQQVKFYTSLKDLLIK